MSDTKSKDKVPPTESPVAPSTDPRNAAPTSQSTAAGTVTVASKLPNGLVLRAYKMVTKQEAVMGGGFRDVSVAVPFGKETIIKGAAHQVDKAPGAPMMMGYALTHDVNAEFFDLWLSQNADSDIVLNKLVFAATNEDDLKSEAKDYYGNKTGLEPVDPNRTPPGIKTADTQTNG